MLPHIKVPEGWQKLWFTCTFTLIIQQVLAHFSLSYKMSKVIKTRLLRWLMCINSSFQVLRWEGSWQFEDTLDYSITTLSKTKHTPNKPVTFLKIKKSELDVNVQFWNMGNQNAEERIQKKPETAVSKKKVNPGHRKWLHE